MPFFPRVSSSLIVYLIISLFLAGFYAILFAQPIHLETADLGRHLTNGAMIVEEKAWSVFTTNLYSYTNPDYPFVNHHWLGGVAFYLTERIAGLTGLSLLFIGTSLAAFLFFFSLAYREAEAGIAAIAALLLAPVIAYRTEIRPEVFSYLFAAIFFWILWHYTRYGLKTKWLFILPIVEILWVNTHIYFFVGIGLVGIFLIETAVRIQLQREKHAKALLRPLAITLGTVLGATLLNPAFVSGAVQPFRIFGEYGYRVVENQSVWFVEKIISIPAIRYFKSAFVVLLGAWLYAITSLLVAPKSREYGRTPRDTDRGRTFSLLLAPTLIAFIVSIAGWLAIRNFTLFGYFALPLVAIFLKDMRRALRTPGHHFLLAGLAVAVFAGIFLIHPGYWEARRAPGLGISFSSRTTADFLRGEKIKGPIFNNYDIGSYLIYTLFPRERVFVDNRPEAYPVSFFQDVYIPIQENEDRWKEAESRYNFNAVVFYRNDLTPWAQQFLVKRISDSSWAPVWVDHSTIIFLKRNGPNQSTIEKYELHKEMFRVGKPG